MIFCECLRTSERGAGQNPVTTPPLSFPPFLQPLSRIHSVLFLTGLYDFVTGRHDVHTAERDDIA
jgi:hypothetical protein